MTDQKDKLVLDTSDDDALGEYFSRKAPGEKCVFRIEGTLDQFHEDMAVISVTDKTVEAYKDQKKPAKPDQEDYEGETTEPAIKMAKRQKAAEAEDMVE